MHFNVNVFRGLFTSALCKHRRCHLTNWPRYGEVRVSAVCLGQVGPSFHLSPPSWLAVPCPWAFLAQVHFLLPRETHRGQTE